MSLFFSQLIWNESNILFIYLFVYYKQMQSVCADSVSVMYGTGSTVRYIILQRFGEEKGIMEYINNVCTTVN